MQTWAAAWRAALYGDAGFYTTGPGATAGPAAHFRTSVHVGEVFAGAVARLLLDVDARLGTPARLDLVDVGAGRAELLSAVLDALPGEVARRVSAVAVEVRPRPAGLDRRVTWHRSGPGHDNGFRGLVVAHELLDDLPCDVVEVDATGTRRLVLVDAHGGESLGPALTDDAGCRALGVDGVSYDRWLDRWWPVTVVGARAEVGTARDARWAGLAGGLVAGTVVAVDYGHVRDDRTSGRHDRGTLVGYADGRQVPARPDGRCDLTAHVAVDACAAAVAGTTLRRQRDVLADLGVDGPLPDRALAADPAAYAAALQAASDAAELRDPQGLGGFWWLRLDRG